MVIWAQPGDITPPRRFIHYVEMVIADGLRAEINGGGGENAVSKIPGQRWVTGVKAAEFGDIFLVKLGRIGCEGTCNTGI